MTQSPETDHLGMPGKPSDQILELLEKDTAASREELGSLKRIRHIYGHVHRAAFEYAKSHEEFVASFSGLHPTFVLSVDIRRSTDLMLKARDPESFAIFVSKLAKKLGNIIFGNFGVFDKFTGDGILAFFPQFYSGPDAGYYCLRAAAQCHRVFSEHYEGYKGKFHVVLKEAGLGIGIDYGPAHIVKIESSVTVVGSPVVYACRFGSAPAGQTYLNRQAYEALKEKYGTKVVARTETLEIKNEAPAEAYCVDVPEHVRPQQPDWLVRRH